MKKNCRVSRKKEEKNNKSANMILIEKLKLCKTSARLFFRGMKTCCQCK